MAENIMLYQLFFVSNDVVRLLKTSLENFPENGLTTVQGVNVVFRIKYILTAFGRLSKLRQLRTETITHILSVLNLSQWRSSNNLLGYI